VLLSHSSVSQFAPPLPVPEAVPVLVISAKSSDGSNMASSISDPNSPPKVVIPIQSNGIDHHQLKLLLKIDSSGWHHTQARQCKNSKKAGA